MALRGLCWIFHNFATLGEALSKSTVSREGCSRTSRRLASVSLCHGTRVPSSYWKSPWAWNLSHRKGRPIYPFHVTNGTPTETAQSDPDASSYSETVLPQIVVTNKKRRQSKDALLATAFSKIRFKERKEIRNFWIHAEKLVYSENVTCFDLRRKMTKFSHKMQQTLEGECMTHYNFLTKHNEVDLFSVQYNIVYSWKFKRGRHS